MRAIYLRIKALSEKVNTFNQRRLFINHLNSIEHVWNESRSVQYGTARIGESYY